MAHLIRRLLLRLMNLLQPLLWMLTPSCWAGSQLSLISSPVCPMGPIMMCANLISKDIQWKELYARLRNYIDRIDTLHKNGQGNSPDCIKLAIERKECQDRIERLEDEILRLGLCPKTDCSIHKKQVRSTSSPKDEF
ncbi:hypothetical protein AVEN_54560-1 [Araneus ventricosus]|uniref:Uncharacterized protein n=1 Tax=Araneus ventricosus TaxID=182803 RepID=A0A4Y2BL06_ARAVE|nr:hypothetical protein AVEN_54560-1 [Araneus ventricosus]